MKILSILTLLFFATSVNAASYKLDEAHSSVEFSIKHLGLFPVKGKFKDFKVEVDVDEKKQIFKSIVVKINVDTIDTNNEDRDAHLKSKDFFNVRDDEYNVNMKYKYIVFKGKNIPFDATSLNGKLKILKKTRKITLQSEINTLKDKTGAVQKIGVAISGQLNRKDYGLTWQKDDTGFLAKAAGKFVGDEVTLNINMLLNKKNKAKTKTKKK